MNINRVDYSPRWDKNTYPYLVIVRRDVSILIRGNNDSEDGWSNTWRLCGKNERRFFKENIRHEIAINSFLVRPWPIKDNIKSHFVMDEIVFSSEEDAALFKLAYG